VNQPIAVTEDEKIHSGIKYARDSTEAKWEPQQINETSGIPLADLHCGECTAPVSGFRRTILRTNKPRSPHFKLKVRPDKNGSKHDPDCKFDLPAAIAAGIKLTRTIRYSRDRKRWQICFPDDILRDPSPRGELPEDEKSADLTDPARYRRMATGPSHRLALLNDIRRVVALLHEYRDHPSAADSFEGIWRDVPLSWDELYYPPDRYDELIARAIAARTPERPTGKIEQPIIVSGQITSVGAATNKQPNMVLRLALENDTREPPSKLVVRGDAGLFPTLASGDAVVVMTRWGMWTPKSEKVDYCTGWLNWRFKIAKIDHDLLDP